MEMSLEEHLKCPSAFFFLFSGPPSLSSIMSSQSTRRVHHHGEPHQSSASSEGTFSRPCQLVRGSKLRLPLFFDRHLSLLALLHLPRRGHGSSLQLDLLRALLLLHQDSHLGQWNIYPLPSSLTPPLAARLVNAHLAKYAQSLALLPHGDAAAPPLHCYRLRGPHLLAKYCHAPPRPLRFPSDG